MRLGAQAADLNPESLCAQLYGRYTLFARHRHRYEVNNQYRARLEGAGLRVSGRSADDLVEMIEIPSHPWFVACQFHPEFNSTPRDGHPLFAEFLAAARKHQNALRQPDSNTVSA